MSKKRTEQKIKAAVFDFGGVIINDLEAVYNSYCYVIDYFGKKPLSREEFDRTFSPDWLRMYHSVGVSAAPEEIRSKYLEFTVSPSNYKSTSLYDGALDALKGLKKKKKIAINTGYLSRELELVFKLFNINKDLFDVIMTEDRAGVRKPNPKTMFMVAEQLGIKPEECVLIGDTLTEIECGKNSGSMTIAVTWGTNSKKDLKAANPDFIVDSWQELRSLLESL